MNLRAARNRQGESVGATALALRVKDLSFIHNKAESVVWSAFLNGFAPAAGVSFSVGGLPAGTASSTGHLIVATTSGIAFYQTTILQVDPFL